MASGNKSAAGLRRSAIAERVRLRAEWAELKGTNSCSDVLRGLVILVEVGPGSRALALRSALSALGASVVPSWVPLVTHVVWAAALEHVLRGVLELDFGLQLNGKHKVVGYADDLAVLGKTAEEVRKAAKLLDTEAGKIGLRINCGKSEYLHMKRYKDKSVRRQDLHVGDVTYKGVSRFKYLGCTVTDTNTRDEEIDTRIQSFLRCSAALHKVLTSRLLSRNTKLRIYKTRPDGSWRVLKNAELEDLMAGANIVGETKAHRLRWLGHLQRMGEDRSAKRAYMGRPTGRRPAGRPRYRWSDAVEADLRELQVVDWRETALDRGCRKVRAKARALACRLVSPLWVEGCASAGRRLPEAAFPAAARPSDLPSPATLRRLLVSRCRLVSPLWVEGCASSGRRLPEAAFPAAARPSDLPSPATLRRLLNIADKENIPLDLLSLADSTNKTKATKLRISSDTDHDTSTDKSTDQSTDKSMEESVESRVNTAPRRALPASTSPEPAKKSRRKLFTYKEEEEKGSDDGDDDKEAKSSKPKPTARLTQRARRDLARAERMARKLANKTANSVPAATQSSLDIVPRIVLTGMTSTERRSIFDSIRKLNGRVQAKVNKKTTHVVLGSCCESEMQDRVADGDRREGDGNRFAGCGAEITGIASLTLKSPPNLTSKIQKATLKLTNGGSKPRTLNALEGAARGCRILSPDWVRASEKAGKWLHPIGYEIEHLKKISQKARIERKILQKTNSDYGYDVFCGLLVKISENAEQKEAATTLLTLCGAKIVYGSTPADVTIGREKGQVASKWVFDSVAAARIRTSRRYTVSSNDDIIDRPVIVENVDSDDVFLSLDNA
ncbi:unnamed protein product [Plutella xylostella]|uniref:(diamondback moth) hypothetical protein n=1 Tax=Plutella xylostella TaxID=51655 RepID=A0A8S4FV85_PLUXY|nr:unnamed protein product [Plutella xylostella]